MVAVETVMEARKLATQMMAICPFALVVGMGLTTRSHVPGHSVLQYSEAQNQRLESYCLITRDAPPQWADTEQIRHHADMWIHVSTLENLQALTPAYQEELTEDNARAEVIGKWRTILQQVNHVMRCEGQAGRWDEAVQDGARLIRLTEILKYSDFDTLHTADALAGHAIKFVTPGLDRATSESRDEFGAAAQTIDKNRDRLSAMYKVVRANYADFLVRQVSFSREMGISLTKAPDEEGPASDSSITNLQSAYVAAIRDEASLRLREHTMLSALNPAKS